MTQTDKVKIRAREMMRQNHLIFKNMNRASLI